jgi:hypothetical protein
LQQPTAFRRAVTLAPLIALAWLAPARAEFKLHYPTVDYREIEIEHNGDVTFDKRGGANNQQSYTNELGYGFTPWWELELELEWDTNPNRNLAYSATTFENTFQLTERGKYWADLGFFAEYSHAAATGAPNTLTFGPLVQKETNDVFGVDFVHTLNLLFSKEVGTNLSAASPLDIAWQTRLRLSSFFEPGIEYYGEIASVSGGASGSTHRIGPVVVGLYNLYRLGKLKYELGYQFGLNSATERGVLRWRLEYEKVF